jgi:hypothetical protein
MAAPYRDHMKVSMFVFMLGVLAAGPVVAQENGASLSPASATAEAGFNLDYSNNWITGRAIDERILDRLGLFDRVDDDSAGYSISLDLEIATGVSKSLSRWNFDSSGPRSGQGRPARAIPCAMKIFRVPTASTRCVSA